MYFKNIFISNEIFEKSDKPIYLHNLLHHGCYSLFGQVMEMVVLYLKETNDNK